MLLWLRSGSNWRTRLARRMVGVSMASSWPQNDDRMGGPGPPTSGASWEQFLGNSTIWTHRNLFYRKVLQRKVVLRVESDSLDHFTDVHGHQGQAGSSSWGTAPSGPPGSCFTEKFINTKMF